MAIPYAQIAMAAGQMISSASEGGKGGGGGGGEPQAPDLGKANAGVTSASVSIQKGIQPLAGRRGKHRK